MRWKSNSKERKAALLPLLSSPGSPEGRSQDLAVGLAVAPQYRSTVEQSSEVTTWQLELAWGGLRWHKALEPLTCLQTSLQASCRSPHPRVPPAWA